MDPDTTTPMAPNGWPAPLLAGFRAGDRAALAEIYRRHSDEVAAFLQGGFTFETGARWFRFAGFRSAFDLQDALHDTFRLAFEPSARQGYDGLRPYAPYLLTIARNVVLRTFRARERLFSSLEEPARGEAAAVERVLEVPPAAETELLREQARALVREFLQTQPEEDRRLLELRFVDGLSQRDVADRIGMGRQRIRTREAQLRERLVEFMRRKEAPRAGSLAALGCLLGTAVADELGRRLLR